MDYSLEEYNKELDSFLSFLNTERKKCFGIQINQQVDDCIDFSSFLTHTLNNLGDPFVGKGGHLQTFNYERMLVLHMANLLGLSEEDAWGYYTSGSTISNLQAIHFAGMKLGDDVTLVTSKAAHNSIPKAACITRIKKFTKIDVNEKGQMDVGKFFDFIKNKSKSKKFIFCFCSGTVAKGAYDNVKILIDAIKNAGIPRENYFIHLDAALGGLITPFLNESANLQLDFRIPEIDSLSVSFHKRLGVPIPGSLFLLRKSSFDIYNAFPFIEDYRSLDTTIPGSRDGLSPFITLMKLKKIGFEEMQDRTNTVIEKAKWLAEQTTQMGLHTIHNKYSPCVYFEAPSNQLINEYHLPLYETSEGKRYTHVFTMEHVNKLEMNYFLNLIKKERKLQNSKMFPLAKSA